MAENNVTDRNKTFQALFDAYKKAYPNKKLVELQRSAVEYWNKIKTDKYVYILIKQKFIELEQFARRNTSS